MAPHLNLSAVTVAQLVIVTLIAASTTFGAVAIAWFSRFRVRRRLNRESRILALDPEAVSAKPGVPAFASRPRGAPVYYGFRVLDDIEVDGFKLGMISDWEAQSDMQLGDAFVIAPDGSRCGLVWFRSPEPSVSEAWRINLDRWGVWKVGFPYPMDSRDNARRNLSAVLPRLKEEWTDWRNRSRLWLD